MVEVYDSAFRNPQKGKERNRTDLIAYAYYEYDRLCFILVPLWDKINLAPHPQSKILVPFRGHFPKNLTSNCITFIWESPPDDRRLKGVLSQEIYCFSVKSVLKLLLTTLTHTKQAHVKLTGKYEINFSRVRKP